MNKVATHYKDNVGLHEAIVSVGKNLNSLKNSIRKLEPFAAIYFPTKLAYALEEIKEFMVKHLVDALEADEREILIFYSEFKNQRGQTKEQQLIAKKAAVINDKLKRWYDKIGYELYGYPSNLIDTPNKSEGKLII